MVSVPFVSLTLVGVAKDGEGNVREILILSGEEICAYFEGRREAKEGVVVVVLVVVVVVEKEEEEEEEEEEKEEEEDKKAVEDGSDDSSGGVGKASFFWIESSPIVRKLRLLSYTQSTSPASEEGDEDGKQEELNVVMEYDGLNGLGVIAPTEVTGEAEVVTGGKEMHPIEGDKTLVSEVMVRLSLLKFVRGKIILPFVMLVCGAMQVGVILVDVTVSGNGGMWQFRENVREGS